MGIQLPKPQLTAEEKRLLSLIDKLLLTYRETAVSLRNSKEQDIPLSLQEARELSELLAHLVESRRFRERAAFVERMGFDRAHGDVKMRRYYFRLSKKSTVASSGKWADFCTRLGIQVPWHPHALARRMNFSYFLRMEERLLAVLRFPPKFAEILISKILEFQDEIEDIRSGKVQRHVRIIADAIEPLWSHLHVGARRVGSDRLIGVATLLANCSVIFTTRDWDVAGTLSAMSGALIAVVNPPQK